MSESTILFPTDFSHTGDAALEMAESIAKSRGAKLLIVHVEEPPPVYGGGDWYYGVPEPKQEQLLEMLQRVVPKDKSIPFEHRLLAGHPAQTIVEVARDEDCSMIVMGTHGRTGLMRMLMGSMAEEIVRKSPCPVLTLRDPSPSPTKKAGGC